MPATTHLRRSPRAAAELLESIETEDLSPFDFHADDVMGETDCPIGCMVEPDGHCPHGYESAALTLGII